MTAPQTNFTQTDEPRSERESTIVRHFDAPARLLFEAWSKPEHMKRWFGPVGWPVTLCEMDFRVGGAWRMQMTGPGGQTNTPFGGYYHAIEPARTIVYDNGFQDSDERMLVTVTFDEEAAGRTKLTIYTLFGSVKMARFHLGHGYEKGTGSGLDQLADLVAALKAA